MTRATQPVVRYKVLTVNQLSKETRDQVSAAVALVFSEQSAVALQQHDKNWSYAKVGYSDRAGVLRYRGIEVALFYSRQINEFEPVECAPHPEGEIRHPEDVWVRVDLLGPSARQMKLGSANERDALRRELETMKRELQAARLLADGLQADLEAATAVAQQWADRTAKTQPSVQAQAPGAVNQVSSSRPRKDVRMNTKRRWARK